MKMKNKWLYFLTLLVLVTVVAGGLKLRHQRQQELAGVTAPVPAPWAVHTATVRCGRSTDGFPALALVKGAREAGVAPRLVGTILEMGPREGQTVVEGALLARIDTRELKDDLASLQAQRRAAAADAKRKARDARRAEELLVDKNISESEADQLQASARVAREQVRNLEKQIAAERTRLGYARITAPFAGVVESRLADPGDQAAVGKPLYRLVATASGRLVVRLPAEVLEKVHPGTEVELEHNGMRLDLEAGRVYPSLDERSLGRLEIDVPELPFGTAPGTLLRARVIV